jgi:hypothetical protein
MKIVIRSVIFHILCIIIFACVYSTYSKDFDKIYIVNNKKDTRPFIDFLLFSTTIQAGVGITEYFPSSDFTKIVLILQQVLMLSIHIVTLYFFTI